MLEGAVYFIFGTHYFSDAERFCSKIREYIQQGANRLYLECGADADEQAIIYRDLKFLKRGKFDINDIKNRPEYSITKKGDSIIVWRSNKSEYHNVFWDFIYASAYKNPNIEISLEPPNEENFKYKKELESFIYKSRRSLLTGDFHSAVKFQSDYVAKRVELNELRNARICDDIENIYWQKPKLPLIAAFGAVHETLLGDIDQRKRNGQRIPIVVSRTYSDELAPTEKLVVDKLHKKEIHREKEEHMLVSGIVANYLQAFLIVEQKQTYEQSAKLAREATDKMSLAALKELCQLLGSQNMLSALSDEEAAALVAHYLQKRGVLNY